MSTITIYAELLLNIRQVTVFVNLPSESDDDTSLSISSDLKSIYITHKKTTTSLVLPCQVAANTSFRLPSTKEKELSFRLQVAMNFDSYQAEEFFRAGEDAPWPAASLSSESRIGCRSCKNILLEESVQTWKDLPSENWAEMMDFWHCHKPDTKNSHDQGLTKGYAAANGLSPSHGVGLVDFSHIVLLESDCTGIQISNDGQWNTRCSSCSEVVGINDYARGSVQLSKWSIRLQREKSAHWEAYPMQKFICAQLLALIGSQATRKFLAYSGDIGDAREALLLWVFNPDLVYSTSIQPRGPQRAMKIFYQNILEPSHQLEKNFMVMDEFRLSGQALQTLREDLKVSGSFLPMPARNYQNWNVGLLQR